MIKRLLLRIYTFIRHPSTIIYYRQFKGTVFYPGCHIKSPKYMIVLNSTIARGGVIKAFPLKKSEKCIKIENCYFGDRAYISSSGELTISNASFSPNVFIGTYRHSLVDNEEDSHYTIRINNPKFIGQNVSIFGNVNIGENVVIGACSVITKPIPNNSMVVGNPGTIIKRYDNEKNEWIDARNK